MREGLNKKEKEILGLRDQITRKEKELLDASDTTLALERDKADLEDKICGARARRRAPPRRSPIRPRPTKSQAAKRADDFKTRGEKVKVELDAKLAELATIGKKHDEELAAARCARWPPKKSRPRKTREAAAEARSRPPPKRRREEAAEAKAANSRSKTCGEELRREREEALAKRGEEAQADKAERARPLSKGTTRHALRRSMQAHEEDQNRLKERVAELSTELLGADRRARRAAARAAEDQRQALRGRNAARRHQGRARRDRATS